MIINVKIKDKDIKNESNLIGSSILAKHLFLTNISRKQILDLQSNGSVTTETKIWPVKIIAFISISYNEM